MIKFLIIATLIKAIFATVVLWFVPTKVILWFLVFSVLKATWNGK